MNPFRTGKAPWYRVMLIMFLCSALLALGNPAVQAADPATPAKTPVTAPAVKSQFSDVPSTDANVIYVNFLVGRGIISGYPDGSYHPDEGLTRAQAATVIVKAAGLSVDPNLTNPFSDVSETHWAQAYIAKAAQAKYISGMSDGSYHPDEKLTRAQAISLILRLSQQPLGGAKLPATVTDIDSTHWAAPSVAVGIASGMVGLSADGKQYLPDSDFTRISLAHALGILLTQDPGLYTTSMEGKLKTVEGSVTIQSAGSKSEIEVKTESAVKAGDIIKTGAKSSAELNYPDGSSMLLKENTQITVVESIGRKYLKIDGKEGTAVEWLDIKLKQGTMLGGLATRHETTNSQTENNKATGQVYQVGSQLIASRGGWELLAAEDQQPPWYVASQEKKVKIKVDMPWGVAAIRGTFVVITVSPNGQSTVGCLTGDAEVTNGGVTVSLSGNQQTGINGANTPPPPTAVLGQEAAALFLQANSWLQATAQLMDQNRPAATPPPPATVPGQAPPPPPSTPPPASNLGAITSAMESVNTGSGNSNSNNSSPNNSSSDNSGTTDQSSFTISGSGPTNSLQISNARDYYGVPLSGQKFVTVSTLGIQILYQQFDFVDGNADIFIPANFPGIFELVISIEGVTNSVTVQVSGWVPVGGAGFTSSPVESTSLALHDSNPYVAYKDISAGNVTVMKYTYQGWTTAGTLPSVIGSVYSPSLAINSNGYPYLAFNHGSMDGYATVMKEVEGDWQIVGSSYFASDAVNTTLAIDDQGIPYVAYRNSNNDLMVSVYEGSWSNIGSSPGTSIGQNDLSFYLENLDGTAPYIAFSDSNNSVRATVMEYVYNNSLGAYAWSAVGASSISSGPADYLSINGNEYHKPYLAYTETSSNQIHVKKYNGSSWENVGSGLPAGTYNSLVVGEDSSTEEAVPILAYIDTLGRASVMKLVYTAGQEYVWMGGPVHATTGDSCPSVSIDKVSGTIYLAFRDGSQGGKMTVMQLSQDSAPVTDPATAPNVVLEPGTDTPVQVVTNVVIPEAGETDTTGAVGWYENSADSIKFTVTDAAGNAAHSTITINNVEYTSGEDYTITSQSASLGYITIVVTTTETGKVTCVRTFTITVIQMD